MPCFLSLKKSRSCRRLPPPALPCRFPGRVPACVGFPERCSQELVLSSFLPPPGYVFSVEAALIRISVSARCGQKRSPETKRRARPGEWTWCDHLRCGAGYACSHTQSEGMWVGCWHVCSTLGLWLLGPRCGPGPGDPLPCFAPLSPACTTSLRSHWAPCHWPCSEWSVRTRPVWAPRGSLSCSLTWVRGLGAGLLLPENLQGSPHRPRSSEQVPRGAVAAKSACGPPGGLRASSRASAQTQPPCSRSDSS